MARQAGAADDEGAADVSEELIGVLTPDGTHRFPVACHIELCDGGHLCIKEQDGKSLLALYAPGHWMRVLRGESLLYRHRGYVEQNAAQPAKGWVG